VASVPSLTLRERRALRRAVLDELTRTDEQIASLSRTFDDIVDAADLTSTDDEHDPDGSTIAFERSQVSSLLRQARRDRAALDATLGRIDDIEFGTCEHCHTFIGIERLLALPSARRCIACAR
jgi:DnaK suppressor protein